MVSSGRGRASAMAGKTKRTAEPDEGSAALVGKAIANIEAKLDKDELKPTYGDLIRLLQMRKELGEDQPREITVSWVEPHEKEDAPGK